MSKSQDFTFIGGVLGQVADAAKSVSEPIVEGLHTAVNNVTSDIRQILGGVAGCARHIDSIRIRATHRAIEYHTTVMRTLATFRHIPVILIEQVWNRVFPQLRKDPNPSVWRLENPNAAVWLGQQPRFTKIEVNHTFEFPELPRSDPNDPVQRRRPDIYVHGKDYDGSPQQAYEHFYRPYEIEAQNNKTEVDSARTNDVYLLCYDTKLIDEADTIIIEGFKSILGGDVGYSGDMVASVSWRELERRAQISGDYLVPLLAKTSEAHRAGELSGSPSAISHSLGCFTFAQAAHRFVNQNPSAFLPIFYRWFCFPAALPANGFGDSGMFLSAPRVAYADEMPSSGTVVWHSYSDAVLSAAYLWANGHPAIGQVGVGVTAHPVYGMDVTNEEGITHLISEGYFTKIGTLLRRYG